MAHNVVIKAQYAAQNLDMANRTVVCESDVDNGTVFKLTSLSTNTGEREVWKGEQAGNGDTGLWMAVSPEVVTVGEGELAWRGLSSDPRLFYNRAGSMIDAILLHKGDIIEMTAEGIADVDKNEFLVPATTGFALVSATSAGTGLSLKKIRTSRLHIGQGGLVKSPVTTYVYEVVNN